MAITTLNGLLTALSTGNRQQRFQWYKTASTPLGLASHPTPCCQANSRGGCPPPAAIPATSAGETYDDSAWWAPGIAAPSEGNLLYLASIHLMGDTNNGGWILVDRMWANSGFAANTTTEQSITQTALPARAANGLGCWLLMDAHASSHSSGTATIDFKYTNTAGAANCRTYMRASWTITTFTQYASNIIPLHQDDTGIRLLQSVKLSATATTAGNWGCSIVKPLAYVPAQMGGHRSQPELGLIEVSPTACLDWIYINSAAPDNWIAEVVLVEG